MIPKYCEESFDRIMRYLWKDREKVQEIFENLFDTLFLLEMSLKKAIQEEDEILKRELIFEIHQLICFTPLFLFLPSFVHSPFFWTRAIAKWEMWKQYDKFSEDPEVIVIDIEFEKYLNSRN